MTAAIYPTRDMHETPVNPFATRFIKPGAVPYLFAAGETAEGLINRLRGLDWQGAIVAPHGSGKSTLLATLEPLLQKEREIVRVTLRQGESSLPAALNSWRMWTARTLVIVDGYEQLSWWSRKKLAWRCRLRGAGRLVTTHAPTDLPTLLELSNNSEMAERVVRALGVPSDVLPADMIAATFTRCHGNLRETLFALYDEYERRHRISRS